MFVTSLDIVKICWLAPHVVFTLLIAGCFPRKNLRVLCVDFVICHSIFPIVYNISLGGCEGALLMPFLGHVIRAKSYDL